MNIKTIALPNVSYFADFMSQGKETVSNQVGTVRNRFKFRRNKLPKNFLWAVAGILLLVVAFYAGVRYSGGATTPIAGIGDQRVDAPKPLKTQELNREFKFPLRDAEGEEVSEISYVIEQAHLMDAFIHEGQLARAVRGRTFLILDLKITNSYEQSVEIQTKDYVRVRLNGGEEQLAPEIHNDPVTIQANSTKLTRLGLPIDDTVENITLFVGEITGEKQEVKLNLER